VTNSRLIAPSDLITAGFDDVADAWAVERNLDQKVNAAAIGVSATSSDLGTGFGTLLTDGLSVKAALQLLEANLESNQIQPVLNIVNTVQEQVDQKTDLVFSQTSVYADGTLPARMARIICVNDAPYNAGPSKSAAYNSAAFNQAILDVAARGGGEIITQIPGIYLLADINPTADSWDNRRCIYIDSGNITLKFSKGVILKLADNQNSHVIQIGTRTGGTTVVNNVLIEGITIDGNRENQRIPTPTDDHGTAIAIQSGCSNVTVSDFNIYKTQYYGIGFQRSTFRDCTVKDGIIADTGADSIDCKDDLSTSRGNLITNLKVRRFGLAGAAVDSNQAGINVRGGWFVDNVEVTEFDGDRHGIRVDLLAAGPVNSSDAQIGTFYIEASSQDSTVGLMLNNPDVDEIQVSKGRVVGCNIGVDSRSNRNQLSGIKAHTCGVGLQIYQRSQIDNCSALNCVKGLVVREDENIITNFQTIGCTTGIEFLSSSSNNSWRGGLVSNNTTNVVDDGTDNSISDVIGIRTNSVGSGSVDITTTGEKTIVVPHGLDFTPLLRNCTAWLERDTVVTDVRYGGVLTYLADASNVYCKVYVTTASATASAVAKVRVKSIAKKATSQ
jgi:hypothetical protein